MTTMNAPRQPRLIIEADDAWKAACEGGSRTA